jgi:FkbM family methyltransferase
MSFYSQDKQDLFLETTIFKGHKHGFFVDVGAHDGVSINNTLFFEKSHNWTGINIEPITDVYSKLASNRPTCVNLCCAVSDSDGTAEFIFNRGYTEMISGLKDHYDPRHAARLQRELNYHKGSSDTITVPTKRLSTIFKEHNVSRVNYLSIDVEGAEFAVIRSIDFNAVFIDVIGFENNYPDVSIPIVKYLEEKGFQLIKHRSMDIFMIHKDSEFLPKS